MLRVAVIGVGEHGWDNILPSVAQIQSVLTVSICDIDKDRADLAAAKYGAKSYYDYNVMIEQEKLDAIIVASYPDVHYKVARLALEKGIAVFVEKPPTVTLEELVKLVSINKQRVTTGVGLNFNYAEAVNIVDELSQSRDFGKIKYLSISHYGNKPKEPLWGLKSTVKSFLLAQVIHPIGFMVKYGDYVDTCDMNAIHEEGNLLISANFILKNSSGDQVIAHLTSGNMCPYFMWRIEFITDRAIVIRINSLWEIEIFDKNKVTNLIDNPKRWRDVWNPSPLSNGYSRTGYFNQLSEFFSCVRSKKQFASNLESLISVYQILDIVEKKLAKKRIRD
jgi:phthalate 4,5-cis-dihydrodiol dehydrogenase